MLKKAFNKRISRHWSFSIPPDNIKKHRVRDQWHEMGQRRTFLQSFMTFSVFMNKYSLNYVEKKLTWVTSFSERIPNAILKKSYLMI